MTFNFFNKGLRHQGRFLIDSTSDFHLVDICHLNIMFSLEIFLDHRWLTVILKTYFTIESIIGDPTTALVVPVPVSLAKIWYSIMELSLLFYKNYLLVDLFYSVKCPLSFWVFSNHSRYTNLILLHLFLRGKYYHIVFSL